MNAPLSIQSLSLVLCVLVAACEGPRAGSNGSSETPTGGSGDAVVSACGDKLGSDLRLNLSTHPGADLFAVDVTFASAITEEDAQKLGLTFADGLASKGSASRAQLVQLCKDPRVKTVNSSPPVM